MKTGGIPSGYRAWCESRGINMFHVEQWVPEYRSELQQWKRNWFKSKWKTMLDEGDVDLIRQQSGRDYLILDVREDLSWVLTPIIRSPYKTCPCHPNHPKGMMPIPIQSAYEVLAWMKEEFGR